METREKLEAQARTMSTDALRSALDWHSALADHADENMDFNGYGSASLKVQVIKAELSRRH
jgi:hypothetical protein